MERKRSLTKAHGDANDFERFNLSKYEESLLFHAYRHSVEVVDVAENVCDLEESNITRGKFKGTERSPSWNRLSHSKERITLLLKTTKQLLPKTTHL